MTRYLTLCQVQGDETKIQVAATFLKDNAAVWWRNVEITGEMTGDQRIQR